MPNYSDVILHSREVEITRRKEEILKIIEDSKTYVMEQDNLIKLRALKRRCEKITEPRSYKEKNSKNVDDASEDK